jgi:hypothetical protein
MAKDTAKILDAPNVNGKVVRTITKQDGLIMSEGATWLPAKGWYGVETETIPDPTQPGLRESDVNGYVKSDTVRCQLGGHWISPN